MWRQGQGSFEAEGRTWLVKFDEAPLECHEKKPEIWWTGKTLLDKIGDKQKGYHQKLTSKIRLCLC